MMRAKSNRIAVVRPGHWLVGTFIFKSITSGKLLYMPDALRHESNVTSENIDLQMSLYTWQNFMSRLWLRKGEFTSRVRHQLK